MSAHGAVARMANEAMGGDNSMESGNTGDHELGPAAPRRQVLLTALAAGVALSTAGSARADDEEKPGSDERPQKGDILVFAEDEHVGQVIKPEDLPLGGPQVMAWPMDPRTKVVRDGSRLNQVLLLRLQESELDENTKARAAGGIVAYSAICAHAGCPVTAWVKENDQNVLKCLCHNSEYDPRQGAEVVFGPAPRHLAALPLAKAGQTITVAQGFIGKVGAQQSA